MHVTVTPAVRSRAFVGYRIRRRGLKVQVRTGHELPHRLVRLKGRAWYLETDVGVFERDGLYGVVEVEPDARVLLTDGVRDLTLHAGVWLLHRPG